MSEDLEVYSIRWFRSERYSRWSKWHLTFGSGEQTYCGINIPIKWLWNNVEEGEKVTCEKCKKAMEAE